MTQTPLDLHDLLLDMLSTLTGRTHTLSGVPMSG